VDGRELSRLVTIGPYERMDRLGEKTQKLLVSHMQQIETGIEEHPVHRPVIVVDAMLVNVAGCVPVAVIVGGKLRQVVEPRQKLSSLSRPE